MIVPSIFRPGSRADVRLVNQRGVLQIVDVEQRNLRWTIPAVRAPFAKRQHMIAINGLDVGGEPGELECARDFGLSGVAKVNREERVDLTERHDNASVAKKTHTVNRFGRRQVLDS